MLSESAIQKKISDYLNALPECWTCKVMSANKRGVPDILAVVSGRFVAIEVKRPGGKPSKLQLAQLKRIEAAGGLAMIAESIDDVIAHLASADITLG
jgi:Holliday junction resolvase